MPATQSHTRSVKNASVVGDATVKGCYCGASKTVSTRKKLHALPHAIACNINKGNCIGAGRPLPITDPIQV